MLVVPVHPELLRRQFTSGQPAAKRIWSTRFQEINDWERHLVDNNIRMVKVLLNVSKDEQAKRFLKRIDRPEKNWKFAPRDIHERRYWDDYQRAFGKMLSHTNTEGAVARGARRPQMVCPPGYRGHSGSGPRRYRSAVSPGGLLCPSANGRGPRRAGGRSSSPLVDVGLKPSIRVPPFARSPGPHSGARTSALR